MKYDKLVRDQIPDIIVADGKAPVVRTATDEEYWVYLKQKLFEEGDEVFDDGDVVDELADVLEVLHAIADFKGITIEEVEEARRTKKMRCGGFGRRLILDEVL